MEKISVEKKMISFVTFIQYIEQSMSWMKMIEICKPPYYCNEWPSEATETPSEEKHAHPPRVVYCAIYLTLTLITKFRVSNLHITTR